MPRPFVFASSVPLLKHVFHFATLLGIWGQPVFAIPMVYNTSVPTTLTDTCAKALLSDVSCDPTVRNFHPGFYYPPKTLERACTSTCKDSIDAYWNAVQSSCGNETLTASFDLEASVLIVPGTYKYLYEYICLQDSGRYCNNVAATAAAIADPGNSRFNYLDAVPSGTVPPDPCDMCFIKSLRLQAGSPYFDGPALASMSAYESMTSKCGVTGQPLTTTTIGFYTEEPVVTPAPCMGKKYSIQPGDDCYSISRSQGVGTAWLLSDNNLASYCDDFPTSGDLCIVNTCKTYTVKPKDTCGGIAKSANITIPQLKAWNPIINAGCYNMDRLNGTQLCISAPGTEWVPPSVTDLPGATVTTPAPVPTDAASGSNTYCGRWYKVKKGDYCNLLVLKFAISMEDFIFLNPAINSNCTNLYADESYCVQAVGDINTYSGKPGYITTPTGAIPTAIETPFPARPNATAAPYERLNPSLPLAKGTRDGCVHYFDGADYQFNLTDTDWHSNCEVAIEVYGVDPESFAVWNAGLGNVSQPECAFKEGFRYCGSYYLQKDDVESENPTPTMPPDTTTTAATTTGPSPTSPTMTGQPSTCNKWHTVEQGDTCDTVTQKYGLKREEFLAWNPSVSSDCSQNFWLGYAYCVGVEGTTPPMTTTTTNVPTPRPTKPPAEWTQPGIAENCVKWDRATSGDYCAALAERNGITVAQLAEWNTALGANGSKCDTQFWLDYYYCVAVSG
ncbi:LysM domain-containing protein [Coccidioides immitis RS]|uniref:LysM domain-containing protein n=3 Tax=Coccidioides immitis TaxID=5501 RepID=J3KE62_COCIM|nr:LysM domain-containing protein [Coccidioides immitis RS]EAS33736.3 LysM domain-containing protein [Coccidioides immitis RS]